LLTLFIAPVVYFYLDKVDRFLTSRSQHASAAALPVPEVL